MKNSLPLAVLLVAVSSAPTFARPVQSVREVRTVFDGGARGDAGFNANLRSEMRAMGLRFVRSRTSADAVLRSQGQSTTRGGFAGTASLVSPTGRVLWSAQVNRDPDSRAMAFISLAAKLRAARR